MNKCIITVIGRDRPGILALISEALFEKNCNIENVSQMILQSEFAGIFIVSMQPDLTADALRQFLAAKLNAENLEVYVKKVASIADEPIHETASEFIITTKGPDRKGLVAAITRVIADYGANITSLKAVFKGKDDPANNIMIYAVDIDQRVDKQKMFHDVKEKGKRLGLDISIHHRNIFNVVNRI